MSDMTDPACHVVTITTSDTVQFRMTNGIYVGTAGALKFETVDGDVITYANASAGYHPLRVIRIYAGGTAATDIHALYSNTHAAV